MKLFLDTYGCALNRADSDIIKEILKENKFVDLNSAEVVIVNSCGVKNATESKIIFNVKQYIEMKKKVVITGCLPRINYLALAKLPVTIVDSNSIFELPKAIEKEMNFYSNVHPNKLKINYACSGDVGIVPISEGCLGKCAYCTVKNARGNLTSYPEEDILGTVRRFVSEGKKEIRITAQDTGCYGFDIGTNLPELLEKVVKVQGDFTVRVGMMNPDHALKFLKLMIAVYKNPKIIKFLHVPVQSGSDKVLKEMGRQYAVKDFEKIVEEFREEIPGIYVSTDIIVGFPSETEKDFQETVKLLKRIKPGKVNLSKFYPRPKTAAAKMKLLPTQVLKERSLALSTVCRNL